MTMRNAPPGTPTTWMGHKENGKRRFQAEEFEQALASYRAALAPEFNAPLAERQILLSNVVACRLKIGGAAQAAAAVEEAKQCVALNESWAKGHVRLASAYIALGDHSNDACNSLQRALALDPGNSQARQMLMRELRRDHISAREATNTFSTTSAASAMPEPTAPPEEELLEEPTLEESLSWSDQVKFYYMQAVSWYQNQSDDRKNLLKVGLLILALYVAFGGRFGLDRLFGSNHHENRGHYEAGSNAYDRYYSRQRNEPNSHARNTQYQSSHERYYDSGYDDYQPRQQRQSSSNSFHFPNLFDGSPQSMLCLAGIAYLCYRNGVNPFHVIMMLNMMNGGRRRGMGMRRRGFGYGGGMGYGGMGGGFGGRPGFQRNRWG